MKLRFFLATIDVFVRQEPSPRTPGRVLVPLNAVKPGGSLWVVLGHACMARLWAGSGRALGATAIKLRFYLAIIGVFVRQEPSPRTPGRGFVVEVKGARPCTGWSAGAAGLS